MKRQLATALGMAGVLAIGTAAAAVNVRMLYVSSDNSASTLTARTAANEIVDTTATAPADPTAAAPVAASPTDAPPPAPADSGKPTSPNAKLAAAPTRGGDDGDDREDRPVLSAETLALLRVAKMTHLRPEVVHAVAKGDSGVSAADVQKVKDAAAQLGISLSELAKAQEPPQRIDGPGHGPDDGDHDSEGDPDDD